MIYENDSRHLPKLENAFTGHRKITGAMLVPIELLTENLASHSLNPRDSRQKERSHGYSQRQPAEA
jgi:hypothetical protein